MALVLAVCATTLLDGVAADMVSAAQSSSWPESLWLLLLPTVPLIVLAIALWFGLLFGGLPLAAVAIVLDTRSRSGAARRSRALESYHYACFIAQVIAVVLSPLGLLTFAVSEFGSYVGVYLCVQLIAGVVAVFSWRRLLHRSSRARMDARALHLAA